MQPFSYYFAAIIVVGLFAYALVQRRKAWAFPYAIVVATIAGWYMFEPFLFPEAFDQVTADTIAYAYSCVSICLIAFATVSPIAIGQFSIIRRNNTVDRGFVESNRVVSIVVVAWALLLFYGVVRMNGNIAGALFPVEGRAANNMWSRAAGAGAGAEGFIVSTAGYIYTVCIASFGVFLVIVERNDQKLIMILLILVSWPFAILQGARSELLAVVLPGLLAFLIFSRVAVFAKSLIVIASVLSIEVLLRLMIKYRNGGFATFDLADLRETQHEGLNMASELAHTIDYISLGIMTKQYGLGYMAEILNIVPRAIWPGKPLLGIDYAIARGFGSEATDIGVFATISTGVIGQAVLEFGPIAGSVFVGCLMAIWVGFLTRLRLQGTPLRLILFLLGLGVTFSLGRDITLLVLWPFVFAYIGIRLVENYEARRFSHAGRAAR